PEDQRLALLQVASTGGTASSLCLGGVGRHRPQGNGKARGSEKRRAVRGSGRRDDGAVRRELEDAGVDVQPLLEGGAQRPVQTVLEVEGAPPRDDVREEVAV